MVPSYWIIESGSKLRLAKRKHEGASHKLLSYSIYQRLVPPSEPFFLGGVEELKLWVYKCWDTETVQLGLMTIQIIALVQAFGGAMQRAGACSGSVDGLLIWCPSSWAKQGLCPWQQSLLMLITCLPPKNTPLPLSLILSPSLPPALICKCRLIRAWGPWWNLAVIVPNFSNIFYCLHHSFAGGRRGGGKGGWGGNCVNYANGVAHFCRLLRTLSFRTLFVRISLLNIILLVFLSVCRSFVSTWSLPPLLICRLRDGIKAVCGAKAKQTPLRLMILKLAAHSHPWVEES